MSDRALHVRWVAAGTLVGALGASVVMGPAAADDDARARFDARVQAIYDYLPGDVDKAVREAKSAEMDAFWKMVREDVETFRPLLRDALRDPGQNLFFCFDGAALLDDVGEGTEDAQLAADSVARCRLVDVAPPGYFRLVHGLGVKGADVSDAALKIVDDPKFALFLPAHSMRLGQQQCLQLVLMTMDEELWVPKAIRLFRTSADSTARRSLLHCLTYAVRPDANDAIRATAEDPVEKDRMLRVLATGAVRRFDGPEPRGSPTTTREQFEAILASCVEKGVVPYHEEEQAAVADALHHVLPADAPRLREARRKIARRVSDESLLELQQVTRWLRRAVATDRDD